MEQLTKKEVDFLSRETLLKTIVMISSVYLTIMNYSVQQGRNFDLLTITEPVRADYEGDRNVKKRVVVVMARQHPGESPSSLMVQGLIDFLVSKHRIAIQLREKLIFKIFPMMNPDGVFLGNYKGSLFGEELWSCWLSLLFGGRD